MKINKNSWHYKFINSLVTEPSDNLCAYFWQLVLCIAVTPFFVATLCVIVVFITLPFTHFWVEEVVFLHYLAAFLDCSILSWVLFNLIKERRQEEGKECLAIEYSKAKKSKYCPKIEFVGE